MDSYKQYLEFLKLPYLSPCLKLRNKVRNKLCLYKLRLYKLRLDKLRLDKLYLNKLCPHKLRLRKLHLT